MGKNQSKDTNSTDKCNGWFRPQNVLLT
jgi:hypothetical protein